jgi:transcriptional regulator with XRE-family HTH domain
MTGSQCRMARAALGWNAQKLATKAGVGLNTVNRFESGACRPRGVTLEALTGALEAAGVEFIAENGGGAGVRLRKVKQIGHENIKR